MTQFKTEHQKEKEEREQQIYAEYVELTANPDNSKMAINDHLMKKYKIYGMATLYAIIKRVEARISNK